jgi:hypothetical protein
MNHRLVDLWESKPAPLHHLLATGHMPIVLRLELQKVFSNPDMSLSEGGM